MKVFISSVRRGLEEERDALPGIILAIGHTPLRFEDFSAQPVPSREACLAGVADADVYLLILGPNYGYRFGDTGQSPTHDEWMAATAAGLPRLVYRKDGVPFEPEQEAFARTISDYRSGVFYESFTTTHELLTKVAAKIRELERAGSPLAYSTLTEPVPLSWRADFDDELRRGFGSRRSMLELHVVPAGTATRSARLMADLADSLPLRLRENGQVPASDGLSIARSGGALVLSVDDRRGERNRPRQARFLGLRVDPGGQVSAWASLPGDDMGAVLDRAALQDQVAGLLRLIGALRLIETSRLAIGIGLDNTMMLALGRVDQLPRSGATGLLVSDQPVRVAPDELVTLAALDAGAHEVATSLSRALVDAFGSGGHR